MIFVQELRDELDFMSHLLGQLDIEGYDLKVKSIQFDSFGGHIFLVANDYMEDIAEFGVKISFTKRQCLAVCRELDDKLIQSFEIPEEIIDALSLYLIEVLEKIEEIEKE